MINLYSNQNSLIIHQLKNVLENCGIECLIRNEPPGRMIAARVDSWIELWIVDDGMFDEAQRVI